MADSGEGIEERKVVSLVASSFYNKEFSRKNGDKVEVIMIPEATELQARHREIHKKEVFDIINNSLREGLNSNSIEKILQTHKMRWMAVNALLNKASDEGDIKSAFESLEKIHTGKYSISKYPDICVPPIPIEEGITIKKEALTKIDEISKLSLKEQKLIAKYIGAYMVQILDSRDIDGLVYGEREPVWPAGLEEEHRELAMSMIDIELTSYNESLNALVDPDKLLSILQDKLKVLDTKLDGTHRKRSIVLLQGPPAVGKGITLRNLGMRSIGSGSDGYLGGGGKRVAERNLLAQNSDEPIPYDFGTSISHTFDIPRDRKRFFPSNLMNIAVATLLLNERKQLDSKGLEDTPVVLEGFPRDSMQFKLLENLSKKKLVAVDLQIDDQTAAIRQIMRIYEDSEDGRDSRGDDFGGINFSNAKEFLRQIGIDFEKKCIKYEEEQNQVNLLKKLMIKQKYKSKDDLPYEITSYYTGIMTLVNLGRKNAGQNVFNQSEFDEEILKGRNYQLIQAFLLGLLNVEEQSLSMESGSRFLRFVNSGKKILSTCREQEIDIIPISCSWKAPIEITKELRKKLAVQ